MPRNFGLGDACRIGIDGAALVIDPDLPLRPAGRIGAGDCAFGRMRDGMLRGHPQSRPANARQEYRQWPT